MSETPKNPHKFDTLSLLGGVDDRQNEPGFSLDEILDEFGGRAEPKKPAPEEDDVVAQIQKAVEREAELNIGAEEAPAVAPAASPNTAKTASDLSRQLDNLFEQAKQDGAQDTLREKLQSSDLGDPELNAIFAVPEEAPKKAAPEEAPKKPPQAESEDAPEDEAAKSEEAAPQRPKLRELKNQTDEEEPEGLSDFLRRKREQRRLRMMTKIPTPDKALKQYSKAIRPSRARAGAVLVLTLCCIFWTLANQYGFVKAAAFSDNGLAAKIMLGLMALCMLLNWETVAAGVRGFLDLRLNLDSLVLVTALITGVTAALTKKDSPLPFCAVVCLELYFAAYGTMLKNVGMRRALKILQKLDQPLKAAVVAEDALENGASMILPGSGTADEHMRGLYGGNLAEQRMSVYAPITMAVTLALSIVVKVKTGNDLLWAWSSMLIAGIPLAGFFSFYRPFAVLSGRLLKRGAAISGWQGAKCLNGSHAVLFRDWDVFPKDHITLNGMKVFGSCTVPQAVGYAAAVLEATGSGLAPLFQELRKTHAGRMFAVSEYKRYEGGGAGAEIGGDVVLLGSLRFMQLMGVYLHEGTKVKNAVYLSVNGEMCGVFALNYSPSAKTKKSLTRVLSMSGLQPVFATRDFLITPLLIKERYKVSDELLEFPSAEERSRLSELPGQQETVQGAVYLKDDIGIFTETVVGARVLKLVTSASTTISMAGGIAGILLMFFLTFLGAVSAVTAINMLIFAAIWAIPPLILTNWAGKF